MTDSHLDDELEQGYLAESRELLANVESELLAIEHSGVEIDEQAVNRVFRAAHSIKSGAGFFDLIAIRDLAQKIETTLDLIRSRQMVPSHEVVDILLLSFRKVRELIRQYRESDHMDIAELTKALTGLIVARLPLEERPLYEARVDVTVPQAGPHVEASAYDLLLARRGGKYIYLIRYDLIRDIQRQGRTPWEVFKTLIESGTILETVLDLHSAGTLDDPPSNQLPLVVLYATALDPDEIGRLIDLPAERVVLVEGNRGARPRVRPFAEPPVVQ